MVETENSLDNYPLPWEMSKLFQGAKAVWTSLELKDPKPEDIAVSLASAGRVYAWNSTLNVQWRKNEVYRFPSMAVQYYYCRWGSRFSSNSYDP